MRKLNEIELPSLTSFDRGSYLSEILARAAKDDEWGELFAEGENSHANGALAIANVFDFMFSKNAKAFNRQFRELFYQHAVTTDAIENELARKSVTVRQNNAPVARLTCSLVDDVLGDEPLVLRGVELSADAASGGSHPYEIITRNEDGSYGYLEGVVVNPSPTQRDVFLVDAYAGRTRSASFPVDASKIRDFDFEIDSSEIVDGSVVVYVRYAGQTFTLPRVKSLMVEKLEHPLFPKGVPHVVVTYGVDGDAVVSFGSEQFGGEFDETHVSGGAVVDVYWRDGGGSAANAPAGAIDETLAVPYAGGTRQVRFVNKSPIAGGVDRETIEDLKAVLHLKAQRDGTILDESDAELALRGAVVKYSPSKPTKSDQNPELPLLHVFHHVVPKRDFDGFTVPVPSTTDDAKSYLEKLRLHSNEQLNLVGIRDTSRKTVKLSDFAVDGDGSYAVRANLPDADLLSGSLAITAYDRFGDAIDSAKFDKTYSDDSYDTYYASYVRVQSSQAGAVKYDQSRQTKFRVRFFWKGHENEVVDFQITQDYALRDFADALNVAIRNAAPVVDGENYRVHTYAFFTPSPDNPNVGSLTLMSYDTDPLTRIEILAQDGLPADSHHVYSALGLAPGVYGGSVHTTKAFLPGQSVYSPATSLVAAAVNDANAAGQKASFVFPAGHFVQDPGTPVGPVVEIAPRDKFDAAKPESIQAGSTVLVKAYDASNALVGVVEFADVSEEEENVGTVDADVANSVFSETAEHSFDSDACSFSLSFKEGVEKDGYEQSYPRVTAIEIARTGEEDGYVDITATVNPSGLPALSFVVDVQDATGHFTRDPGITFDPVIDRQFVMTVRHDGVDRELDVFTMFGGGLQNDSVVVFGLTPATGASCQVVSMREKRRVTATVVVATFENDGTWDQNADAEAGTAISLPIEFTAGYEYSLTAYYDPGTGVPQPRAVARFDAAAAGQSRDAVVQTDDQDSPTFDVAVPPRYAYSGDGSRVVVKFSDGERISTASVYARGFVEPARIEVEYDRKPYDRIDASYMLNVYKCTDEAATLLGAFKASDKRLLAVEHMFRRVSFVPTGVGVSIFVDKKYPLSAAKDAVEAELSAFFAYDNDRDDHAIGSVVGADYVKSLVLALGTKYGIREVQVTFDPSTAASALSENELARCYLFAPPKAVVEAVRAMEALMPNVAGASDAISVRVSAKYVS